MGEASIEGIAMRKHDSVEIQEDHLSVEALTLSSLPPALTTKWPPLLSVARATFPHLS
jgi:hypothetical protein